LTYIPDDSKKPKYWAVKHLGKHVEGANLFTPEVFTQEVLEQLDEKVIRPTFELPTFGDDLQSYVDVIVEDDGVEDEIFN
jgi:hypothetical protein